MSNFKKMTYDNSYLFNKEANIHHKVITEFIISSARIDKNSAAFKGVLEEIKRVQNSSVLFNIIMMDDVVLCIGKSAGMPRAFKVFEAKDLANDHKPKIFIDVTELMVYKDGYFTCRAVDKLVTYLFSALGYLLYSKVPIKLISQSEISISGTECFVSLFTYIIDYLRIIGYSQNKEKISYIVGLYFLYHMMGKDIDSYTKSIAAKVAGLSTSDTRGFELYYDPEKDFMNIATLIELISNTFKLKGFTLETFIHRWNYSYGNGTYYATELFTSFMTLITASFCGSYIVNQKQVERCCGTSEVKFCNALLRLGASEFDRRGFMSESEFDKTIARDKLTVELKESFFNKNKLPKELKMTNDDFKSKSKVKTKLDKIIKFYLDTNQEKKLSAQIKNIEFAAMRAMGGYNARGEEYEPGTCEIVLKTGAKYLNEKDKRIIYNEVNSACTQIDSMVKDLREKDPEKAKRFARSLVELRKLNSYLK